MGRFRPPTTASWRTRRRCTPREERPLISRPIVVYDELWPSASEVKNRSGVVFLSRFVYPKVSTFRPLQRLEVEV